MILIAIAVGLSMDAFSLSVLYGMNRISKKNTNVLSLSVGLFHFIMPLLGFLIGNIILKVLPMKPEILVGSIFLILSLEMFFSIFKDEKLTPLNRISTILLFSFTVSIDSFTVGIGLGTINSNLFLPPTLFSITSFLFTYIGLKIGKYLKESFGKISTLVGSIILFVLSLIYIF